MYDFLQGDELEKALRKLADALEDGNKEEALPLIKSVPKVQCFLLLVLYTLQYFTKD